MNKLPTIYKFLSNITKFFEYALPNTNIITKQSALNPALPYSPLNAKNAIENIYTA